MKRLIPFLTLVCLLLSCGEEGREVEKDVNGVMKKIENSAEVLADSAKEKYKDVRDHLDTALDRDKDDTLR
jgi:ElaB/YqjD/DUF883 family membrane-anchored ribosome-binding protein